MVAFSEVVIPKVKTGVRSGLKAVALTTWKSESQSSRVLDVVCHLRKRLKHSVSEFLLLMEQQHGPETPQEQGEDLAVVLTIPGGHGRRSR
jgi:hypothetical protein